ncbi:MAG TPA: TadE family protein [Planctomycetota bacterium]|nr:TadE family protein [Planctomycetota bacterium]
MRLVPRLRAAAKRMHDEQESGVAMTEFAIAFPLQFFVTLAVMQFSLILVGHVMVQQAAFAGARAVLVADVPLQAGNASPGAEDAAAKRAACFVLNPIATPDSSLQGGGSAAGDAIHVSGDDRQNGAYALTRVTVSCRSSDDQNYVGVYVEHDFLLVIPVVNHWFAKLANPGEFWYGPTGNGAYNSASQNSGLTCLTLRKSAFLPKPWRGQ